MPDSENSSGSHVVRYERLRKGSYYADFRRDKRIFPEVYHCIIQREGAAQILSWSQYRSLERALLAAERELKRFAEAETETVEPENSV